MMTQQQVLEGVCNGSFKSKCIDNRDFARLIDFFDAEHWDKFGFSLKEGTTHTAKPWTDENILDQLRKDVAFGFEKAIDKRGISSSLMHSVVKMWLKVLEDKTTNREYGAYGLTTFKSVALKYGFPNEIGEDDGDEGKYFED